MKKLDVPQSGSQADTTASRNRFGQYNRTRRAPVNVNSTRQSAARNRLSELSIGWAALDDADRATWEVFAAAHPVVDSLGSSVVLTGHQSYISVNAARGNAGLAYIDVPGTETSSLLTVSFTAADDEFDVTFTATPVPAGEALVIEASMPVSPGRSFNGDYRYITTVAAAGTSPADALAAYEAKFGSMAAYVGKKIFLRAYMVGGSGASTKLLASAIVAQLAAPVIELVGALFIWTWDNEAETTDVQVYTSATEGGVYTLLDTYFDYGNPGSVEFFGSAGDWVKIKLRNNDPVGDWSPLSNAVQFE